MSDIPEGRPWTVEEKARLLQAKSDFVPYRVIAEQLGRSPKSCERMWSNRPAWMPQCKASETASATRELAKQEQVTKLATAVTSSLELGRMRTDIIADRVAEVVKALPELPMPAAMAKKKKKNVTSSSEDAGLLLSDLHVGLKYSLEETGGLAEYSLQIFLDRLAFLKQRVTRITQLHNDLYRMPTINVFMLGDNTHGMNDVGKWSPAYMECNIIEQVFYGVNALTEFIYYLLTLYENVNIFAIGGNHGRAANKGVEKEYVNWDYVVYKFIELKFRDNPRVHMEAPKAWYIYTTIRDHRFLLLHGDDIRPGTFPVQNLLKAEDRLSGLLGSHPHYTLAGHYHTAAKLSTNHGRVYLNGAFTGGDPYSLKNLLAGGTPEQLMFGIDNKRGVTWEYNLRLNDAQDRTSGVNP